MSEVIGRNYGVERKYGIDRMGGLMVAMVGAVTIYSVLGAVAFGVYKIFMV
jgi:hypothetical protein